MKNLTETKHQLSADQRKQRDNDIKIVKDGLGISLEVAAALMRLRDDKSYLETDDTFAEFCQREFGITPSYAYRLIGAAEVKGSLPKSVGKHIVNERQARALADVPEEQRAEVVRAAAKEGPVTETTIKEAAAEMSPMGHTPSATPSKPKPSEKPIVDLDKTGYPIPNSIIQLWKDASAELNALLRKVSEIRTEVRVVMEAKDDNPVWRGVSPTELMVLLDNAYRAINAGIPHAVCPYCQGRVFKSCRHCNQTGYMGKFALTTVPKEMLDLRAKSCPKQ